MWTVLHVITTLELGGAQLATLHEAAHGTFAKRRRALAFGREGLLHEQARQLPAVRCFELEHLRREVAPLTDLRAFVELYRVCRRLKAEHGGRLLVHTHSSKAGVLGRLAAFTAGADCIVHSIHGFGHSHHGKGAARSLMMLAERVAGLVTSGFTADSAANLREGARDHLLGDKPARVVRCGIDLERFASPGRPRHDVRAELGVPASAPLVINVSCLKPQKDPEQYVRIAARVLREVPEAHFLLVGDGLLRAAVERLARELGITEHLHVLGWRHDVADLLHASDLLALTSRWEGLPQVLPQAMAAGLAIVATAVDGNPEAVSHEETGLLVPAGDVDAGAAAVTRLLCNDAERRAFAAAGQARAAAFSAETMVGDLDRFYAELTGAPLTAAPENAATA